MASDRPAPVIGADELLVMVARLLADGDTTHTLDAAERAGLLALARVVAHASERATAPLSTYVAGLALASAPPADRGNRIAALVRGLEEAIR